MSTPLVDPELLDFWINHNLNVLLVGKHGIGKTAIVKQAFDKAGLKARYFSAATMDPWVDFVGVPRMIQRGDRYYLELIKPREFEDDEVEALFFDEFNRCPVKVRNAVMELLQFKSINGRQFHNLRMIWAAINPYEANGSYDVDRLDPAHQDRFHIYYEIPYRPCPKFFTDKYGSTVATALLNWWNALPHEAKDCISPRRLEYAIDIHKAGGDVRAVLPPSVSIKEFLSAIASITTLGVIRNAVKNNEPEVIKTQLTFNADDQSLIKGLVADTGLLKQVLPHIPQEVFVQWMDNQAMYSAVVAGCKNPQFREDVMRFLVQSGDALVTLKADLAVRYTGFLDKMNQLGNVPTTLESVVSTYAIAVKNRSTPAAKRLQVIDQLANTYLKQHEFVTEKTAFMALATLFMVTARMRYETQETFAKNATPIMRQFALQLYYDLKGFTDDAGEPVELSVVSEDTPLPSADNVRQLYNLIMPDVRRCMLQIASDSPSVIPSYKIYWFTIWPIIIGCVQQ